MARYPSVSELDFTGKVSQTNTIAITRPRQLPLEHMRSGMQAKIERQDLDRDKQYVWDIQTILAQQQPQTSTAIDGTNPFRGHLIPQPFPLTDALPISNPPPLFLPCTQR
jgi:hypothetical protein